LQQLALARKSSVLFLFIDAVQAFYKVVRELVMQAWSAAANRHGTSS